MINHAEKIDCGAFVGEKFLHHFWQKTFSAESQVMPDPESNPIPTGTVYVRGRLKAA